MRINLIYIDPSHETPAPFLCPCQLRAEHGQGLNALSAQLICLSRFFELVNIRKRMLRVKLAAMDP